MKEVAAIFIELMARLHYPSYGAHGGDWGAGITMFVGGGDPGRVTGVHVNFLAAASPEPANPSTVLLSAEELIDLAEGARYEANETGYVAIQSTKPQTLAYGLTDSPAALAAWIVEKFRTWADCGGDIESTFTKDELLTNITIYWVTGTINSSRGLYYESLGPDRFTPLPTLTVPLGHARFPRENSRSPRAWVESAYPTLTHWTSMPRGGHFAAMEAPDLLVEDIRSFFRPLRKT
jgi:microsomal epoxide hydrolase